MEKVLRRIVENDLFVKLEKYIWKVREVGFLEVTIGPNRIKIEKKGLESSKLISTKEYEKCAEVFGLANYYRQFVKCSFSRGETLKEG